MGEERAIDGGTIGVNSYISPDRAPESCAVCRKDIFCRSVVGLADEYREFALGIGKFYFSCHIDIECVAFYFLAGIVDNHLFNYVAVKHLFDVAIVGGDLDRCEYLTHFVGVDVVLLSVAE